MPHPYPDRRRKLENGKRVHIYFDPRILDLARQIGNGNLSQGIRIALEYYAKAHDDTDLRGSAEQLID